MIAGHVQVGKATGCEHAGKFKFAESCNISSDLNYYSVHFSSIQFFIISVLHQQPEGQLQMQHKRRTK
jgi:hypothetical protein